MRKPLLVAVALVAGIFLGYLAAVEADRRRDAQPAPAPIGVTVDPARPADAAKIERNDFDYATIIWRGSGKGTARLVRDVKRAGLRYAFFVPADQASISEPVLDRLYETYSGPDWIAYKGRPVVYSFGRSEPPRDPRFTIIRLDNRPGGDQFWVSNPPNWKNRLLTLTATYSRGTVSIDEDRSGDALDQQTLFAKNYQDRVDLLLWHSWNVAEDKSGLSLPGAEELLQRAADFNADWQRP